MNIRKLSLIIMLLATVVACSGNTEKGSYPKSPEEREQERIGRLTGEGLMMGKKRRSQATESINVNSYIWRASLDKIYFMPIVSADPFGGTIITDWYKASADAREQFKVSIVIIGNELRSDAVKVSVYKKKLLSNGKWSEQEFDHKVATEIEEAILLRAREIKIGNL